MYVLIGMFVNSLIIIIIIIIVVVVVVVIIRHGSKVNRLHFRTDPNLIWIYNNFLQEHFDIFRPIWQCSTFHFTAKHSPKSFKLNIQIYL